MVIENVFQLHNHKSHNKSRNTHLDSHPTTIYFPTCIIFWATSKISTSPPKNKRKSPATPLPGLVDISVVAKKRCGIEGCGLKKLAQRYGLCIEKAARGPKNHGGGFFLCLFQVVFVENWVVSPRKLAC